MRVKFRKTITVAMAVLATSAIALAGCSNSQNSPSNSATPGSSTVAGETPKGPPINLTVELFDRSNTPAGAPPITDNFMTQYVQKNFGDPNNITVKFITVPRSEEVKKLNVLMASGTAPDLVFTYDKPTVQSYVQSGGIADLGPAIEKYGPQLKKVLAPTLKDGVFNGKQFTIPALRVIQSQTTSIIRKDWLEKLNLPLPTTTDEWYQTLKAFKEKDPGNTGGKVIPFTLIDMFHIKPLTNSFWDWNKITEEDLFADPDGWTLPGNKEAFKFLNKLYNEGLLDKDFPLAADFSQTFNKQVVGGLAGSATPNTNDPIYSGYYANLKKNNPEAVLATIDPFKASNGKYPKPMYSPSGVYLMVPAASKNVDSVIKYLNWMAEPKNLIALQFGQEGVSYKTGDDGIPFALTTPEANQILFNNQDYAMIMNGKYVSTDTPEKNMAANATDPQFKDFTISSIKTGARDGYTGPRVDIPIQAEIKYSQILNDKVKQMLAKIITAKSTEVDSIYDQQLKEWKDAGGEAVMKERRQAYQQSYKK
ncbi:extracellular solute-binding protein [Paenibacillus sp. LjRoot56]|uniref:extracellular solute-binding protein n=1 Tax=Paenibacillus sp. LjRoot56 TaxID=3342333 RepID=UPI003ECD9B2F